MKVNQVVTRRVIQIEASADEWQLYGFYPEKEDNLYTSAGERELIADLLNTAAANIANACATREEFEERMGVFVCQPKYSKFGAADTEGRDMIWQIANEIYGRQPRY